MVEHETVPAERIERIILSIRGQKVILDRDLAELYGVTTGNLNKALRRNLDRFPPDFMFQLKQEEYESLRFHLGILKRGQHSNYLQCALRPLMAPPERDRKKIKFGVKESAGRYGKKARGNRKDKSDET
jgi:hypothetical protein